jgi:benzil reductase ((S)-benzoin forming)
VDLILRIDDRSTLAAMASLVWVSGSSSGVGRSLAQTVPWPDTKVIGISRSASGCDEDLRVDLSDPGSWPQVERSFRDHLEGFDGDTVAFFHSAADVQPLGFAGDVDPVSYTRSVLLNSAAPQVLGNLFLAAVQHVRARRLLVLVTSAAASMVMAGATAYLSGKMALDQWVRIAGAEQAQRSGTRVLAIGPGAVDTPMQAIIRQTSVQDFPSQPTFVDMQRQGSLLSPDEAARRIWAKLGTDIPNGTVLDVGDLAVHDEVLTRVDSLSRTPPTVKDA